MRVHFSFPIVVILLIFNYNGFLAEETGWFDDCSLEIYISDTKPANETHKSNFFDCVDLQILQRVWCDHFSQHPLVFYRTEIQHRNYTELTAWSKCQNQESDKSLAAFTGIMLCLGFNFALLMFISHMYKSKAQRRREEIIRVIVKNDSNNKPMEVLPITSVETPLPRNGGINGDSQL